MPHSLVYLFISTVRTLCSNADYPSLCFSKNVAFLDIFLPFSCFRVPFIARSCDDEVIDVRDAGILAVSL